MPLPIEETLARNLQRRMAKGNINRHRLAIEAGLTWPQIDAILHGLRSPELPTLEKLADGLTRLGMPTTAADLLQEGDKPPARKPQP